MALLVWSCQVLGEGGLSSSGSQGHADKKTNFLRVFFTGPLIGSVLLVSTCACQSDQGEGFAHTGRCNLTVCFGPLINLVIGLLGGTLGLCD